MWRHNIQEGAKFIVKKWVNQDDRYNTLLYFVDGPRMFRANVPTKIEVREIKARCESISCCKPLALPGGEEPPNRDRGNPALKARVWGVRGGGRESEVSDRPDSWHPNL